MPVNWDAWSAIATGGATLVALFLPIKMAKREWARQDNIRQTEADRAEKKLSDAQRQVCSAADRVLAYRESAIAIFGSEPVYSIGIQAVRRIHLNTEILLGMLAVLQDRPDLTDGTLYTAVSAKSVATAIVEETRKVIDTWGSRDPRWAERKAALVGLGELASMVQTRSDVVRQDWMLNAESTAAKRIRNKYLPLADAISTAIETNGCAPNVDLTTDYN